MDGGGEAAYVEASKAKQVSVSCFCDENNSDDTQMQLLVGYSMLLLTLTCNHLILRPGQRNSCQRQRAYFLLHMPVNPRVLLSSA